jgi:hypothetical protein
MGTRKERYQTRLDPDDAERVEHFADEHNITKAEAVRRLIQTGLDAEEGVLKTDADEIRDHLQTIRTDGGQVANRLDRLETYQERERRRRRNQTITSAAGIAYIVAVLGFGFEGVLSLAVGIAILVAHVWAYIGTNVEATDQ